ncbi:MAG: hypothetical protein WKG32_02700 [Gemmatimonadaceae bacterium]
MTDDRFDDLMRDAARSYRVPPEPAPLDAIWAEVEQAHFGAPGARTDGGTTGTPVRVLHPVGTGDRMPARGRTPWTGSAWTGGAWTGGSWMRTVAGLAAGLLLGLGIGRYSARGVAGPHAVADASRAAARVSGRTPAADRLVIARAVASSGPYTVATTEYLGQTAALLLALPEELRTGRADRQFIAQAGDLLSTTRLLIDSPASADPELHSLLSDLELVLAQIARLRATRGSAELDLITGTLEGRDVILRLRSAVADMSSSDN